MQSSFPPPLIFLFHYHLLFKQNCQACNFFVVLLSGGLCLWTRKATSVSPSLFFTCAVPSRLGWGVSPLPVCTGALSTLCKHTLLLEAGLPVTSRSLLTEDQLRHFLSEMAERLPVHKNKSTHKTPSLGLYS